MRLKCPIIHFSFQNSCSTRSLLCFGSRLRPSFASFAIIYIFSFYFFLQFFLFFSIASSSPLWRKKWRFRIFCPIIYCIALQNIDIIFSTTEVPAAFASMSTRGLHYRAIQSQYSLTISIHDFLRYTDFANIATYQLRLNLYIL